MNAKRENVLQRLEARSKVRLEKVRAQRAEAAENADPRESSKRFWKEFNEGKRATGQLVEDAFEKYKSETRKQRRERMRGDPEKDPVAIDIKAISTTISRLQEIVTSASYFLPKYDVRSAQESVEMLEASLKRVKEKLRPPKKFSFAGVRNRRQRGRAAMDAADALQKKREEKEETVKKAATDEIEDAYLCGLVIRDRSDAVIRIPDLGASCGTETKNLDDDVTLSNLNGCVVGICKRLGTARFVGLKACHVYCGPIDGSVFIDRCQDCKFVLASRQVRIHSTTSCTFEVRTNSGPIIEDCTKLLFGPYPDLMYPRSHADFEESTLSTGPAECWKDVQDFKWLRTQASPHWSILPASDRSVSLKQSDVLGMRIAAPSSLTKQEARTPGRGESTRSATSSLDDKASSSDEDEF
eukprot:g1318.t1